jgi:hypothetical protein
MGRDIETTCCTSKQQQENKRQRMIHLLEHWQNILHERLLFISIFMNFYLILLHSIIKYFHMKSYIKYFTLKRK